MILSIMTLSIIGLIITFNIIDASKLHFIVILRAEKYYSHDHCLYSECQYAEWPDTTLISGKSSACLTLILLTLLTPRKYEDDNTHAQRMYNNFLQQLSFPNQSKLRCL